MFLWGVAINLSFAGQNDMESKIDRLEFLMQPEETIEAYIMANINNINAPFSNSDETMLDCAAVRGRLETLKFLLKVGADQKISHRGYNLTTLHAAAMHGRADSVAVLLESGGDPNQESLGEKPLNKAIDGYVISLCLSKKLPDIDSYKSKLSSYMECVKLLLAVTEVKPDEEAKWKRNFYTGLDSAFTKTEIESEWNKFLALIR